VNMKRPAKSGNNSEEKCTPDNESSPAKKKPRQLTESNIRHSPSLIPKINEVNSESRGNGSPSRRKNLLSQLRDNDSSELKNVVEKNYI